LKNKSQLDTKKFITGDISINSQQNNMSINMKQDKRKIKISSNGKFDFIMDDSQCHDEKYTNKYCEQ
jgi:hypothetical protein